MTSYNSDQLPFGTTKGAKPTGTHGEFKGTNRLHAITALPAAAALNDTINIGFVPPNAVVSGVRTKAQSQLDSNGSPALTLDLGIVGTLQLFQAAISTVGRAAGATSDATIAGAGALWKNTTGAKVLIVGTIHAAAATGVAGNLEHEIAYFVEE